MCLHSHGMHIISKTFVLDLALYAAHWMSFPFQPLWLQRLCVLLLDIISVQLAQLLFQPPISLLHMFICPLTGVQTVASNLRWILHDSVSPRSIKNRLVSRNRSLKDSRWVSPLHLAASTYTVFLPECDWLSLLILNDNIPLSPSLCLLGDLWTVNASPH